MKDSTIQENAQLTYDLISDVVNSTGPRLPGSEEEKKGANIFAMQLDSFGFEPHVEKFKVSPRASVASVPTLGILGFISIAAFYLSPAITFVISILVLTYGILQIFTYTGAFDFIAQKYHSQNVYASIEPKNSQIDRTIVLSGHMDSSWNWKLSLQNPKTLAVKLSLGTLAIVFLFFLSLVAVCKGAKDFTYWETNIINQEDGTIENVGNLIMMLLPLLSVPGCFWLTQFLTLDKETACPGAMDNMSGVALSLVCLKYFKEHPESMPKNTRLMCVAFGSEEAGLKGSKEFCKVHKKEFNDHYYVLNLDSFRDKDSFNVIEGDRWMGSHFDKELVDLSLKTMEELGIENPIKFTNPAGGCDSTSFYRAGVKTVTLSGQSTKPTNYYHTNKDTVANLKMDALEQGFELVTTLVPKIAEMDMLKSSKPTKTK